MMPNVTPPSRAVLPVKVLMIEGGAELEMGIPPNIAILVSALKMAGMDIRVFSLNDYQVNPVTGDQVRVNTLQVPPTAATDVIIQPKRTPPRRDFLAMVEEYRPDIIGFSTTEATYKLGLKLLDAVCGRDIPTIVGGAYPTLCPEIVIAEDCVDMICVGEGEEALVELCLSIRAGDMDTTIGNLWFKENGRVIKNPIRSLADIDRLPFQDWSIWPIPPRAAKPMAGEVRTTALVELTRGCPFRCTFCANNFLNKQFKGNYRERSIGRFIAEISHLRRKYNLGFIYIADETILTTSAKRFAELIAAYESVKIPFWCQTRPESITRGKIEQLAKVGLGAINVGIESGNAGFRKAILGRDSDDEKLIHGVHEATAAGVRVGANVIIGFPNETRGHIFETIDLLLAAKPTSTMVHLFQPYARTPLREECIRLGLIKDNHICGDYRMDPIGTGALSPDELLGLQRTFNLYLDLPKDRWDEIEEAERLDPKGNAKFALLAREYQFKRFDRASF